MKIGFDTAPMSMNAAGERRYALGLVRALGGLPGIEVAELTMSRRRPRGLAQRVAYQAVAEALYYPLLLGRRARRAGVDLVHHPRHLVPPELGLSCPSVVTVHDVLPLSDPQHFSQLILRRYGPLARSAVRHARLVITSTEHVAGEIVRLLGVDRDRIRVTPWGVEQHFGPVEPPDRGPYVLCVGTLEPRKNLIGALSAFERVAPRFPDHALVLVGGHGWKGGPLERALASTRARVERTGHVSDEELVRLYSGADCFLFPSFAEGFGFPALEAMACGAPVIASDRTSLPEVVGDAGVLVDPSDGDALAKALAEVLSSAEHRAELRERGLARAERFSWTECARLTVDAYGDALAG